MCVCVCLMYGMLLLNYFPWCNFANAIYQCGIRWWNRCARCHVEKLKLYIYNNRNCEVQFYAPFFVYFALILTSAICYLTFTFIPYKLYHPFREIGMRIKIISIFYYCIISILYGEIFCNTFTQFSRAVHKFFYTSTEQNDHRDLCESGY